MSYKGVFPTRKGRGLSRKVSPLLKKNIARIAKRCPKNITSVEKCVKLLCPKVLRKLKKNRDSGDSSDSSEKNYKTSLQKITLHDSICRKVMLFLSCFFLVKRLHDFSKNKISLNPWNRREKKERKKLCDKNLGKKQTLKFGHKKNWQKKIRPQSFKWRKNVAKSVMRLLSLLSTGHYCH